VKKLENGSRATNQQHKNMSRKVSILNNKKKDQETTKLKRSLLKL
jgi:hypothetical protein